MTSNEILRIENALDYIKAIKTYPNYSKTKTEFIIDIPSCKYSGVYLKIPLIRKFTVQVFFPKENLADFNKINKANFTPGGKANYKTLYLYDSPTVPIQADIEKILIDSKHQIRTIGLI